MEKFINFVLDCYLTMVSFNKTINWCYFIYFMVSTEVKFLLQTSICALVQTKFLFADLFVWITAIAWYPWDSNLFNVPLKSCNFFPRVRTSALKKALDSTYLLAWQGWWERMGHFLFPKLFPIGFVLLFKRLRFWKVSTAVYQIHRSWNLKIINHLQYALQWCGEEILSSLPIHAGFYIVILI